MTDAIKAIENLAAPKGGGLLVVVPTQPAVAATVAAASMRSGSEQAQTGQHDSEAGHAQLLAEMVQALQERDVELHYSVDPELKRVVVELRDRADGTVLRQIPSEELLQLARRLKDGLGGLIETQA